MNTIWGSFAIVALWFDYDRRAAGYKLDCIVDAPITCRRSIRVADNGSLVVRCLLTTVYCCALGLAPVDYRELRDQYQLLTRVRWRLTCELHFPCTTATPLVLDLIPTFFVLASRNYALAVSSLELISREHLLQRLPFLSHSFSTNLQLSKLALTFTFQHSGSPGPYWGLDSYAEYCISSAMPTTNPCSPMAHIRSLSIIVP